jgi:hypothetical protein
VLRAGRRGLQMVLRLLAHNAEHWLANGLNATCATMTNTAPSPARPSSAAWPASSTSPPPPSPSPSKLPPSPRIARALTLLIDEISHLPDPSAIPGDSRPITYRITANPVI